MTETLTLEIETEKNEIDLKRKSVEREKSRNDENGPVLKWTGSLYSA
jgi:hypothetical protein